MTTSVDEVQGVNLTAVDRCDRCGAQAYVRVAISGMTLDFCAHDYKAHGPALVAKGATIVADQRSQLAQQPGASV